MKVLKSDPAILTNPATLNSPPYNSISRIVLVLNEICLNGMNNSFSLLINYACWFYRFDESPRCFYASTDEG